MQRHKLINLAYLVGTLGFFAAWCIAAASLAALQSSCSKDEAQFTGAVQYGGILAPKLGSNCRQLFRFPWFVLALGFLPVLLDFLGVAVRGRKAGLPLYAAAVPLYCIVANMFYNMHDVGGMTNKTSLRTKFALAGFAIAAAMALLQMCAGALMGDTRHDRHHDEVHSYTTTGTGAHKDHVAIDTTGDHLHHGNTGHAVVDNAGHHGRAPGTAAGVQLVPQTITRMVPASTVDQPGSRVPTANAPGPHYNL